MSSGTEARAGRGRPCAAWCALGLWLALAGPLGAQGAAPGERDRAAFRASLTATLLMAGFAADSAGPACRVVAVEWRSLPGAAAYQVQVSVGSPDLWVAVSPDPRCPGGGPAGGTAYRDRVPRPASRRYYRVVATAADGRGIEVTAAVPVDVK